MVSHLYISQGYSSYYSVLSSAFHTLTRNIPLIVGINCSTCEKMYQQRECGSTYPLAQSNLLLLGRHLRSSRNPSSLFRTHSLGLLSCLSGLACRRSRRRLHSRRSINDCIRATGTTSGSRRVRLVLYLYFSVDSIC